MVGEEDLVAWKFFSLEFTFVIVDGQEERRRPCGGNGHVNKCSGRDQGEARNARLFKHCQSTLKATAAWRQG